MTGGPEIEDALLEQARQQTDALKNIQGALMLLTALAILAAVIGLVVLVKS